MVGLLSKGDVYMLIAIKNVVDESIDDGRFTDCLISQKYDLVL
jgi:hypothetical protein